MWNEEDQTNAFNRRIARDMPYMPDAMKVMFYVVDWMEERRLYFIYAGIGLLVALSTYLICCSLALMGGHPPDELIGGNPVKVGIIGSLVFIMVRFAPNIFGMIVRSWHDRRKSSYSLQRKQVQK